MLSRVTVSVRSITNRNDLCDLHKPTYYGISKGSDEPAQMCRLELNLQ